MVTKERFDGAATFTGFLQAAEANADLWRAVYERARVPEDLVARARSLAGPWYMLVILEDWCGDAVNTTPYLARLAEQVPALELRVVERDRNPDLMDAHLAETGARAIPVVMILDAHLQEVGWWGSRPGELAAWVRSPAAQGMSKDDRYRELRRWYARDRGRTTLEEVLQIMESAAVRTVARELEPACA